MELKECPPGSLAAAAGLCKGMVLRRVNDCPVSTPAQANNASQKFASIVKLLFDPQEAKEQQRGSAHMFLQRPHSATGLPWGMVIDPATMRVRDVVKGSIAAGGDLPLYVSEGSKDGLVPAATGNYRGLMMLHLLGTPDTDAIATLLSTIGDDVDFEVLVQELQHGEGIARQVITLHEKSGHVGRDRLVGMIRRARGDAAAAAAESILREHSCSVCDRRKPKLHGAATELKEHHALVEEAKRKEIGQITSQNIGYTPLISDPSVFIKAPLRLVAYGDASFCRNEDGTSQGGYAAVLTSSAGSGGALLEWSSARIRRICRSTLGAELLVTVGATDAALWLTFMLTEIGLLPLVDQKQGCTLMPGTVMSDAKS
eukprot:gene27227-6446_t